jgi:hypothetical protein
MGLFSKKKGPSFAEIEAARRVSPEKMALMATEEEFKRSGVDKLASFANLLATGRCDVLHEAIMGHGPNLAEDLKFIKQRGMSRRYVEQLVARAKEIRRHYHLST